jgi:hypothetical protein
VILPSIPKGGFSIHLWGKPESGGCGAVGCTLGWAASDPKFRKKGLVLRNAWNSEPFSLNKKPARRNYGGSGVTFENYSNTEAGQMFFGLTLEQARSLFLASGYQAERITRRMVAAKITKILAADAA